VFSRLTRLLAVAVVVPAAVSAVVGGLTRVPRPTGQVAAVSFRPVPLDPTQPGRDRVGPLVFRGGLWLSSPDPRFGGLSDLRVVADGTRLLSVADCGTGVTATLTYDPRGWLAGVSDVRLVELVGTRGEPLREEWRDSESLVETGHSLEVGFEGMGRVWAYAEDPPFGGPARSVPVPAGLALCGYNGGIETMTRIDEQRRLLVCETRRAASLDVSAWVGAGEAWTARSYPLLFEGGWAGEPFRATAATLLPDGDVLVLERRFPPFGARITRLVRADVLGTGPLHPREIARFEYPLTLDNFEGIDSRRDGTGHTYIYVVSDDNACAKRGGSKASSVQRTLLLMFELVG
jgi:hypothetical protein